MYQFMSGNKEQKIYTDKFVRITTATEILTGEGMEANQDFSSWVILKPRGTIALNATATPATK